MTIGMHGTIMEGRIMEEVDILRYIVTGEEMQEMDAYCIEKIGIPSMVLMERAAMAVTQVLSDYIEELELSEQPQVLIVTEGGNNGGDGLAIARMLSDLGYGIAVYQIGGVTKESDSYQKQKEILRNLGIPVHMGVTSSDLQEWKKPRYDIIIDAVFGVGLKRDIRSPQKEVIEALNQLGGLKCAVDMPSGIDSTSGKVLGTAFRADVTITFGWEKTGQIIGKGPDYCGDVLVADIGFPTEVMNAKTPKCYCYEEEDWIRLPKRNSSGNKGTFGKVTVIAGSESVCGAALLSGEGAYRTGCGLVEIVTHVNNRETIQNHLPEALLHVYSNVEEAEAIICRSLKWADVVVIGPGIGTGEIGKAMTMQVMKASCPLVVDADAVTILAGEENWWKLRTDTGNLVLTPHRKEMERISHIPMSRLQEIPWSCAAEASDKWGGICVLKDARTVVTEPEQYGCYINFSGNDGMATGGSGDVLTGIIAALAAQGLSLGEAARMGVYLHGAAGDRAAEQKGHYSMLAGDILTGLTEQLKEMTGGYTDEVL